MTQKQIEVAQTLLRHRADLTYYLTSRILSHATVTLYCQRSGPGNDRDSVELEVSIDCAQTHIRRKISQIEHELRELGVTIDTSPPTAK